MKKKKFKLKKEYIQHEFGACVNASQQQKCVNCCNALCDVYIKTICNDRGDDIFFK